MHGPKGSRRKQSDYAIALGEKQKLRYQYGLLERQFRRIFQTALRKRGVTGETLLQLLETRLDNVVFVGRPAFGQENNTVGMFKLVAGSNEAVRTPVKLGKSSVNTIEILSGLNPGDQVILSDTSAWDSHERIRLN